MKTSVKRFLQKLPFDKQFYDSDDELFQKCLGLLKIKKGYRSSGGMILELANYNDIIKGKKKKRIQRRRSLSNVSSTDSNPSHYQRYPKRVKGGVIDEVKHKITPIKSSTLKRQKKKVKKKFNITKKNVKSRKENDSNYWSPELQEGNTSILKTRKSSTCFDHSNGRTRGSAEYDDEIMTDFESLDIIPLHMLQSGIMKIPNAASNLIGSSGEISVTNASVVYDRDDVDIDRACTTTADDELPTGKEFVSVLEKRLKTLNGDEFELALRVDQWGSPALKEKTRKPGYQAFIKTTPTLITNATLKRNKKLSPLIQKQQKTPVQGRRMSSVTLSGSVVERSHLGYDRI